MSTVLIVLALIFCGYNAAFLVLGALFGAKVTLVYEGRVPCLIALLLVAATVMAVIS